MMETATADLKEIVTIQTQASTQVLKKLRATG